MKDFLSKVGAFFKKVGSAIVKAAKSVWAWIKEIPWTKPIKPVIAWSVIGGTLAIAVALMLIFWL